MKNTVRVSGLLALALTLVMSVQLPVQAEDIDLFLSSPPTDNDTPNVLIILDNTANWNTAFNFEKQALVDTFEGMDPNAFNVGLMMFGESPDLGYVRAAIRPMSDTLAIANTGIDPNNPASVIYVTYNQLYADMIGAFDVSGDRGNARTLGRTVSEAYQYLQGLTSNEPQRNNGTGKNDSRDYKDNTDGSAETDIVHALPGNAFDAEFDFDYNDPPEPGVCATTYVIYIGNNVSSGNVTKDNTSRNTKSKVDLEAAASAMGVSPSDATALITDGFAYTAHQGNYADEWARFMHDQHDVVFYAVDVDPTPHPDYDGTTGHRNGMGNSELVRSMSEGVGGGKYFRVDSSVGGGAEVADALGQIFSEIQAENSVFASVALPASSTGTGQTLFLNQVFIGLFRPDGSGYPKWPGNLKQYQLGRSGGTIKLFDAEDELAINSSTGFVTECARSFWTDSATDAYWDFAASGLCGATESEIETNSASNSPDGPYVEKGAQAYMLRENTNPLTRNVYTCGQPTNSCTTRTDFDTGNTTGITATLLDANDPTDRANLINWAVGLDILDENKDTDDTDTRAYVHGDVIHSQPVALNYGDAIDPAVVVYYGGNDGMLRAINGNQEDDTTTDDNIAAFEPGEELWSFMPPEFFPEIKRLMVNTEQLHFPATGPAAGTGTSGTPKAYGMDGPITAYEDVLTDQKYIYTAMRRGGRSLYAFDVSDPNDPPTLMWKRGCDATECSSNYSGKSWADIGQTWSPANIAYAGGHTNPVLIMGGGYDDCEDYDNGSTQNHSCVTGDTGDHIYVIDAVNGNLLQVFDTARAVPGSVVVVPLTDDPQSEIAFAYATDTGGNVYRISGTDGTDPTIIGNTAPSTWIMTKIAAFGCGDKATSTCTANRKFLFGPDVVRDLNDSMMFTILAGTGDREKPLLSYSGAAGVQNYFYSFVDQPLVPDWLDDKAGSDDGDCGADVICMDALYGVLAITVDGAAIDPYYKGYFVPLAATEQVVTGALVVGDVANFSTHIPYDASTDLTLDPNDPNAVCQSKLGTATTYRINFEDAGGDTVDIFTGGLVPTPVAGMVTICEDGECSDEPFCIGCGGENSPIGGGTPSSSSSFKQSKGRVYWNIEQL